MVFKDPLEVNADRVHLHLEHPLVARLLNRFLMRGFQTDDLSRAAVLGTGDDTAKLILLARLSLYGHGAARLHDEVMAVVAEWDPADPARRLRVLNEKKSDQAIADLEASLQLRLRAGDEAQRRLREALSADVVQLRSALEQRVEATRVSAQQQLEKRAEEEATRFVKVLQEQRHRITSTRARTDTGFDQLVLGFAKEELRQVRDNRSYWEKRLAAIERDVEQQPALIRRTFEVRTHRVEPAGALYLWPSKAGGNR